jgi:hypothetical protein
MNFEESIYPLTEFLLDNNFSVTKKSVHFIEYSSSSATISVAYASLEYSFYIHAGQNSKSLTELTPIAIKEVFKDDSFRFQSTLTIDNLMSLLKTTGKSIVIGDKDVFNALEEFADNRSREYTRKIVELQNIQWADNAWIQKDYLNFIKFIDKTEKNLLPESYQKKYKIAVDKLQKRTK